MRNVELVKYAIKEGLWGKKKALILQEKFDAGHS